MTRPRAVVALALVAAAATSCSATVTNGHLSLPAPTVEYQRAVAAPLSADDAQLIKLGRANDNTLTDYTPVCAQLAQDSTDAAAALRSYPWPASAIRDAHGLADGLDVENLYAQQCAGADDIDSVNEALNKLPNLIPLSTELVRALSG